MKQAVLYLTNKSNEWTLSAFHALEQSLQGKADVYFAYHRQGDVLPVALQNIENLFVFTLDVLNELGYTPIEKGKLVPGSNHFPLLKFYKENQGYDYYWLVEDDVRFSGEWKEFFDSFASCTSDFLSSVIETKAENPNWYWWASLKTGNEVIAEEKLLKAFNPIYRLSRQALACIDAYLRIGWMGHHEVLLPTLLYNKGFLVEDFGGVGAFVCPENKAKFYNDTSMRIAPVLPDDRKNYLFHPVKEEKIRQNGSYKKNAVFVAAGEGSLHRQLLKGDANFDLHLLIYDGSYSKFCNDTDFIACDAGYKMDMTYRYLHRHPDLLDKYEYFFLMDDDIEMSTEEVNKLFGIMKQYHLRIAQPSLVMSYYTYEHTLRIPFCVLRYTNFVEMMVPCFSKEALVKVLPTFERKVRGCGIEYHWSRLIHGGHKDMAIIDNVNACHVRPLRHWECQQELISYFNVNNLNATIITYSSLYEENDNPVKKAECLLENNIVQLNAIASDVLKLFTKEMRYMDFVPFVTYCCLYSVVSNKRFYMDIAKRSIKELYLKHQKDETISYVEEELMSLKNVIVLLSKIEPVIVTLEKDLYQIPRENISLENSVVFLLTSMNDKTTEFEEKLKQGISLCLKVLRDILIKYNINI